MVDGAYDNSTGTATSNISRTVVVNSDNIDSLSTDKARINRCVNALKNAGFNAVASSVHSDAHSRDVRVRKNSYIVNIVGGLCAGTMQDYCSKSYQYYMTKNNNKVGQALYARTSKYKKPLEQYSTIGRSPDDNFSGSGFKGFSNPAETLKKHNIDYCTAGVTGDEEEFANAVVNMVKNGSGGSGGSSGSGGSTAVAVEGFTAGAKGTTPQFWNAENFEPFTEIPFMDFEIVDENPRIMTASFETTKNIDLTEGRVAVLITGDCNDFGGIILKKEYDSQKRTYKYQCQGFMDRIMANPIYLVANGSKTVHQIIKEILADCGLPDTYLLTEDDYDTAITDELKNLMNSDKDLTETSDMYSSDDSSTKTTTSTSDGKTVKTVTKTLSSTSDGKIKNTMKRKPVGIYDEDSTGDLIRTLIYDYGINIDFYGDINGIPHFDTMDLDAWKRSGYYLSPLMGFDSDYTYTYDITNIITQAGIKNIQASNGMGEMYTSEELLGVNVENFVGRMGVVLDNPQANVTYKENENDSEEDEVEQVKEQYQDSAGRSYNKTQIIDTDGQPTCNFCIKKTGGIKPVQQTYSKSWLNRCPSCAKNGILKSDKSVEHDYKTVCTKCGLEYCQFCGYERKNGKYQLIELYRTSEKTTTTETQKSMTDGDD